MPDPLKPHGWIASSKKDLLDLPGIVQRQIGFALYLAQKGGKHPDAKPLQGFGGAGVLEMVSDHNGDTFRAVYTVRFADIVYVLHCFQKKSTSGVRTARQDIDLIHERLRTAQTDYEVRYGEKED